MPDDKHFNKDDLIEWDRKWKDKDVYHPRSLIGDGPFKVCKTIFTTGLGSCVILEVTLPNGSVSKKSYSFDWFVKAGTYDLTA